VGARAASRRIWGLLALVTISVGWIGGALAQPDAYSSADDDLSDLGALTANKAWIYNQIGDNLTGILIILCALGLWRAVRPSVLGQIGAGAVLLTGLGAFLDGIFRLDCRGIDQGCTNDSWHSSAHKMNNRVTVVADTGGTAHPGVRVAADSRVARRVAANLAAVPASIVCGVLFSLLGDGAAVRATTLTWFVWLALLAAHLIRTTRAPHARIE
jgi:hypothetical protein